MHFYHPYESLDPCKKWGLTDPVFRMFFLDLQTCHQWLEIPWFLGIEKLAHHIFYHRGNPGMSQVIEIFFFEVSTNHQQMVNWWFGAWWFPKGSKEMKGIVTYGESQTTQTTRPQTTNLHWYQLSLSDIDVWSRFWKVEMFRKWTNMSRYPWNKQIHHCWWWRRVMSSGFLTKKRRY